MYTFPGATGDTLKILFSLSQYVKILVYTSLFKKQLIINNDCPSNCNLLRWMRRGSPSIEQVVKPACADGTAVMWEYVVAFFKTLH
jgi:hypothetical protein